MIDTHCHIHFRAYQADMDEVIRRNLESGVRMITVGTQSDTSRKAVEVAQKYDGLWCAIGLHPNHTTKQTFEDELETIKTRTETFDKEYYRELAADPKVVAVGECGLDYYRIPEELDRQQVIKTQKQQVRAQLDLADELDLPVILHCRGAHADMIEILKEYTAQNRLRRRGVAHCFTGTLEEARLYNENGFLTSFTGIITFNPRKSEGNISPLQRVVRETPLEFMMLETDAPYLSPEPRRGERNEPMNIKFIAKKIAELKAVSVNKVFEATTYNAERLFTLK